MVTVASQPTDEPAFAIILISTLDPDSTDESGVISNPNVNLSPLLFGSARSLLVGESKETQPDISSPPALCACTAAVHAVFPVFATFLYTVNGGITEFQYLLQ